jgi:hypothetical protein
MFGGNQAYMFGGMFAGLGLEASLHALSPDNAHARGDTKKDSKDVLDNRQSQAKKCYQDYAQMNTEENAKLPRFRAWQALQSEKLVASAQLKDHFAAMENFGALLQEEKLATITTLILELAFGMVWMDVAHECHEQKVADTTAKLPVYVLEHHDFCNLEMKHDYFTFTHNYPPMQMPNPEVSVIGVFFSRNEANTVRQALLDHHRRQRATSSQERSKDADDSADDSDSGGADDSDDDKVLNIGPGERVYRISKFEVPVAQVKNNQVYIVISEFSDTGWTKEGLGAFGIATSKTQADRMAKNWFATQGRLQAHGVITG